MVMIERQRIGLLFTSASCSHCTSFCIDCPTNSALGDKCARRCAIASAMGRPRSSKISLVRPVSSVIYDSTGRSRRMEHIQIENRNRNIYMDRSAYSRLCEFKKSALGFLYALCATLLYKYTEYRPTPLVHECDLCYRAGVVLHT